MRKIPVCDVLFSVLCMPFLIVACGNGGGGGGGSAVPSAIALGYDNTLVVLGGGSLLAWGDNDYGELGTGTYGPQLIPVEIGSITDLASLAAGYYHTLGIKKDGTLWAWGRNAEGQLGTSGASGSTPTRVNSETDWSLVSGGQFHSLAVKTDGSLWAWGDNQYGQLGTDLAVEDLPIPSRIGTGTAWRSISAGQGYNLAVKTDGTLWAWGYNHNSECGTDDALLDIDAPMQVGTATSWSSVSAGLTHGLAIRTNGTLWGWGNNSDNKIGVAGIGPFTSPVQVGSDNDWAMVSGGRSHSVGLKDDGSLWAWGKNDRGQLGTNLSVGQLEEPTRIGADADWVMVRAGNDFTVAVRDDGSVWTWGTNQEGQVGNGVIGDKNTPTMASSVSPALWGTVELAAGGNHALAVKSDGSLWAWGSNVFGPLGTSMGYTRIVPTQVGSGTDWESVWAAGDTSLGLKDNGTLWAWGDNRYSQLATSGLDSYVPLEIGTFNDLEDMGPGYEHILAVRTGELWAWGRNDYGQCGTDSSISTVGAPARMGTGSSWESVTGGDRFSMGIRTDGSLWGWGWNHYSQLGTNGAALAQTDTPTRIGTANDWSKVVAGYYSSYAIKDDGSLWAWGRNTFSQCGIDSAISSTVDSPARIGTSTDWRYIAGGLSHALGIKNDGSLWAWGYNSNGVLGLGTGYPVRVSPPTRIGSDTDWAYVAAGQQYSIGVKDDGTLYGWGQNNLGQVPDGTACVDAPQRVY